MADDLAQEAFIKAYKNLPKLRDASRFRSWLYQIAYRLFLSHIRKPKHLEQENPSLEPADTDTRRAVSLRQDIESALHQLTEKECATIHLAYMEGCTHVEISEILDLPLGSVKTLLLKAKSKLEKYLKDWKD